MKNVPDQTLKGEANRILYTGWGIPIIAALISASIIGFGLVYKNYNYAVFGCMVFWFYSICYALYDIKYRFNYFFMVCMLFVFLLSRPVISALRGDVWWYWSEYTLSHAIITLYLGQVFMLAGCKLVDDLPEKKHDDSLNINVTDIRTYSNVLLIFTLLSAVIYAYSQVKTYSIMRYLDYSMIYTHELVSFPIYISPFLTLYPYFTFCYLALMPEKKKSILILGIYIVLGLPLFLLGNRSSLVVRMVFAFSYFCIRNIIRSGGRAWVTRKMIVFLIVFTGAGVVFLGAYNYTRAGKQAYESTAIATGIDFFYRQGTTFDTLCQGFEYEDKIKALPGNPHYCFSDLIDNVKYNIVAQKFFGAKPIGNANSVPVVEKSNSLAHRLSYVVLGEYTYTAGYGRGSSYLLEAYMDGGYIGVIIISLCLGAFLSYSVRWMKLGSLLLNYSIITALSKIFTLPRSSFSSFLLFITTPHFWFILFCLVIAKYFHWISFDLEEKRRQRIKGLKRSTTVV